MSLYNKKYYENRILAPNKFQTFSGKLTNICLQQLTPEILNNLNTEPMSSIDYSSDSFGPNELVCVNFVRYTSTFT